MNTSDIENILRHAPQPKAPGILKQQLKAQALRVPRRAPEATSKAPPPASWLARWWPALAPAAVSLACAAILTGQRSEMRTLDAALETGARRSIASVQASKGTTIVAQPEGQNEVARLQTLAANLRSEVAKLDQTRLENDRLRAQIASSSTPVLTAEETEAMEQASQHALSIQCVNNLKQLGLAARVWAIDNGETNPPTVLSMSNEMGGAFKILVCPADKGRQPAADPSSFTSANCSYEYLAPSSPLTEPSRILFRCPIHGSICLCDGSVQMEVAKKHPEWIVEQDGKLYMKAQ